MEDKHQDQPATKADVQAVKADVQKLSETVTRLAIDLSKTQADVRRIEDNIATKLATKDDIGRVISAIDAFAAQALSYQNHDKLRGGKIMEHETKIENHEGRLVLLEAHK